ncbi:MAG: MFS transporter [Geminicoccaceae bacterium]
MSIFDSAHNPLSHRQFRWMFASQILSLLGVGILTMALSLTAWRIGGTQAAGTILGLILALKMIAYVFLAPLAEVWVSRFSPRRALITLDALRMVLLLPMVFADSIVELAGLAFVFFAVSAAFTPLYQATIPAVLTEEKTYVRALSFSRLAYTLESVLSPILAGLALSLVSEPSLFILAAFSLALSVIALLAARLDVDAALARKAPFLERLARGIRIELKTPRLRGLLAMNLALSLGLGWVLVNSVVFSGLRFGDDPQAFTTLMTGYGAGAAIAALSVPALLERLSERRIMLMGCTLFALATPVILLPLGMAGAVALWAVLGCASSMVMTPGGLVLNRSANREDRPALFAAQFSLSHAAWLIAYPLAGWAGAAFGAETSLVLLGAATAIVTILASRLWPSNDPLERRHSHADLPPDHPHLRKIAASGPDKTHEHVFHIDEDHPKWAM